MKKQKCNKENKTKKEISREKLIKEIQTVFWEGQWKVNETMVQFWIKYVSFL